MKNEKLKERLNHFCNFCYWLLRHALMMAITGLMALLYYEAGKVSYFDYQNIDEVCEHRAESIKKSTDEFVHDLSKVKEGAANEE